MAGIDAGSGAWSASPPTFTRFGSNKAELSIHYYGGPPNRTVFLGTPFSKPSPMNESDILSRLSSVERTLSDVRVDVGSVKTQLQHVATKTWIFGGVIAVLVGLIGGFWWIAQQFLIPLLKAAGGAG